MPEPLYGRRWNQKLSASYTHIANKTHGIYVTGIKYIVRTNSSTLPCILQRGIRFWRVRFVSTLEVVCTATAARVAGGRRGYWPVHSYRLLYHWNRCLFEVQAHKLFLKLTEFSRACSEPGGTRWRTGEEMKGKLANGVGSQYSHAASERGVSNITNADAHTSAASSRLNWAPNDLNGLFRFWERWNLVSARVPSRSARAITPNDRIVGE